MPILDDVVKFSKQSAIASLLESGVDINFIQPLLELLRAAVINGDDWRDFLAELEVLIVGIDTKDVQRLGRLDRYIKQVTTDAVNQFNAEYIRVINEETGIEWFTYSGSLIKDSRLFCKARRTTKDLKTETTNYYHKKEVEAWATSKGIPKPSGQWQGMIQGTNESNIFRLRGGWNCRHLIVGVPIDFVPQKDIDRNIKNGNFTA